MLIRLPGLFEYEEYISLKSINDPNEGQVLKASAWVRLLTIGKIRDDF